MPTYSEVAASLWPKGNYPGWFVRGAASKARLAYGTDPVTGAILDVGAIRPRSASDPTCEVLMPGGWTVYVFGEHAHSANTYNRVGAGWSFGSDSIHNSGRGWFTTIYGRAPNEMENVDVQFNKGLFDALRRIAIGGSTEAPPIVPSGPPGAVSSLPPTRPPVPEPPHPPPPPPPPVLLPSPSSRYFLVRVDSPLGSLAIVREVDAATVRGLG